MHTASDPYSGRPVAVDAYPPLAAFRERGSRSFHRYSFAEVRDLYVANTEASPLYEDVEPEQSDHTVRYRGSADPGATGTAEFRVRVYDPRSTPEAGLPTPVILFLHGGGWVMGDLRTHHGLARRIAVRSGLPLVAVDYRLAPEHRYPAAIEDCREAVRWLLAGAGVHGLKVSGLSLVGDSAGGQLAAVLANELVAAGGPVPVDCQVLLYPVTDLSDAHLESSESYHRMTVGFPLVAETMMWFADAYVDRGAQRLAADVSPALHDLPPGLPPTMVITVDNDPLADEGIAYAGKLATAGVAVHHEHLVGYAHGLFTSAGAIATGERYTDLVADYIAECVGKL